MSRVAFQAEGAATVGPYSHAVQAGDLIYLSGQTPINPTTGKLAEGGIAAQTEQCFENLSNVLKAASLTLDDVIKVNVYLVDMSEFAEMNAVYSKKFSSPYPARSTVGVAELLPGARVEIEMIAKKR